MKTAQVRKFAGQVGSFNSIGPFAKLGSTTLQSCVITTSPLAAKRLAACRHLSRVLEGSFMLSSLEAETLAGLSEFAVRHCSWLLS